MENVLKKWYSKNKRDKDHDLDWAQVLNNLEHSKLLHSNRNCLHNPYLDTWHNIAFLLQEKKLGSTSNTRCNRVFQQNLQIPWSNYTTSNQRWYTDTFRSLKYITRLFEKYISKYQIYETTFSYLLEIFQDSTAQFSGFPAAIVFLIFL